MKTHGKPHQHCVGQPAEAVCNAFDVENGAVRGPDV